MRRASPRSRDGPAAVGVRAVGVDVTAVARIAALLERQPRFRVRCFTAGEAATCGRRPERWASRWAAKEAVRKVYGRMGWRIPAYRAIEVVRPRGQAPVVAVNGGLVPGLEISLTHDAGVAIAIAALGGLEPPGSAAPPSQASIPLDLRLPDRPAQSHKGTYGTVLVVAGGGSFPGAAALCALGALRGGAGKVACATPLGPGGVAAFPAEVILRLLPVEGGGGVGAAAVSALGEDLAGAAAVVCGPGLGQAAPTAAFLAALMRDVRPGCPLVLDADALNLCARDPDLRALIPAGAILTPHPAEMGRLLGLSTAAIQADRASAAGTLAREVAGVVVLKGAGTVIADAGGRRAVDPHATAVLATGGTGDVLAGLIAALAAQGLAPFEAARAGVFLHGEAGAILERERGRAGLLASEVADACVGAQETVRRAQAGLGPAAC